MATKLELQQINTRLASENLTLREQLSREGTDLANVICERNALQQEIAFLRGKLVEADARARKLIAAHNRVRSAETSPRRAAMEAAKIAAMKEGRTIKVGG